jgi:hypothetical protein
MRRSTSLRRACAATASVGLAAGLAWLPAGPASAVVQTELRLQGVADVDTSTCPLSSGGDQSVTTPVFTHGKRTRSVNFSATFTNTGDSADTVQASGHYRATWAVAKQGRDLHKASVTGSGSVSLDVAKGKNTACGEPSAAAEGGGLLQFTEHHDGWFYVERTTPAVQGIAASQVVNAATNAPVQFDIFQGGESHAVSRGFSKAGGFNAQIVVGVTAGNGGVPLKRAPHSSVSMVFYRSGSALTGTKGAGKSYVAFPGSVSCGAHKATLRWKSKAGHVAAGSFLVNGKKKASDGSPKGGEKIVLRHLRSTADITVTAQLQLENGGSATATRSYVPCKG